ncbi:MAG TPA: hypothetical protein DCL41_02120, partial [Bdellovibrionales bacterium]|nr:hypothetical protein [Bdellovibrionales bacterium]
MKFLTAMILVFGFMVGCSSKPKSKGVLDGDPQRMQDFNEAMQDLSYENYASASSRFESLLNEKPVSELDLVIMYNSAVALEGLGNCQLAADRYRSVARVAIKRFEKIAALAVYRLGFAYSCLGDANKSIVAFLDAKKKSSYLPPDVSTAELPARLAAAYASVGRQKEALFYFNQASEGLKRILATAKRQESDVALAAKTLYAMGKLGEVQNPI